MAQKLLALNTTYGEPTVTAAEVSLEGELKIKVYAQAGEPSLTEDEMLALWIDTDDSNKVRLIFKKSAAYGGQQVAVELT